MKTIVMGNAGAGKTTLARRQLLFERFDGDKRELRHPGPAAR